MIPTNKLKDLLIVLLIIVGVIALGLLAVNQALAFRYKSVFLQTPCDVCKDLNPHLSMCFNDSSYETNPIVEAQIERGGEEVNYSDLRKYIKQ